MKNGTIATRKNISTSVPHIQVRSFFVTVAALTSIAPAAAQSVIVPPTTPTASAPATASSGTAAGESTDGSGILPESLTLGLPFAWRKFVFRPNASYRFTYGNGIRSSTNGEQNTVIQTISPGMFIHMGPRWSLDYSPSITLYSDKNFKDTVNHTAKLSGNANYEDWTFRMGLSARISSDPQTETAEQTDQQDYGLNLSALRQLNSDFSLDLSGTAGMRLTSRFTDSRTYSTTGWLNRQLGENFGVGVGLGLGLEDVDIGSDMTYEQLLARANWQFGDRFTLSLNGGAEVRQFMDSDRGSAINPVMSGSLSFHPFEPTTLTLSASRSIRSSLHQNQITETTSVNVTLKQRFLGHLFFSVSGGYSSSSYESSLADVGATREDSHTSFSASLGTSFLKHGSALVFHSISDNSSDRTGFGYTSNQTGFQIGWAY